MAELSPRLAGRLASLGFGVRSAAPLSGGGHTPVWKLELEDGRRAILRRFKTSAAANDVWRLLRNRPTDALPRALLLTTRHLVVEYVDGQRLDRALRRGSPDAVRRRIRETGALLAHIHDGGPPRGYVRAMSQYKRVVTRMMRRLAGEGLLDPAIAQRIAAIDAPAEVRLVRSHGDPSPDNLVVTPGGGLRAIDVERLAVRPVAFDLARAVNLWPVPPEREPDLLDAYAAAGGAADEYRCARPFWTAVALSTSVAFRLHYSPAGLPPVLRALGALGRGIG